jgi:hypothetical protein
MKGMLDKQFDATLQKSPNKGGWTYVVMPDARARARTHRASGALERSVS